MDDQHIKVRWFEDARDRDTTIAMIFLFIITGGIIWIFRADFAKTPAMLDKLLLMIGPLLGMVVTNLFGKKNEGPSFRRGETNSASR